MNVLNRVAAGEAALFCVSVSVSANNPYIFAAANQAFAQAGTPLIPMGAA
jgi:hypothetical protein